MKIRNKYLYLILAGIIFFTVAGYAQTAPNTIQQRQKLAYEYEQLGDLESALRIFQELYQTNPNDFIAFEGVKRVLVAQNRLDDAIVLLENRLKFRYDLHIHSDLGALYYLNNNQKQASRIWDELLEKNQGNASAYQYVARAMLQSRQSDTAIQILLQGRKQFRDENLFSNEIANIYAAQNDYKNATIEFLKTYRANPNQLTLIKLSLSRFVSEDTESAPTIIRLLNQEIGQNPGAFPLRELLVDIYLTSGNYENAFAEIVLLDENPKRRADKKQDGKELFEFGNNVINDGQFLFAEKAFNLLIQKYPASVYAEQALFGLARSYQLQDNHSQALQAYEQLIQRNNRSYQAQEALFQIGDVKLHEQFKPAEARAAYQKVLKFYQRGEKHDEAIFRIGDCFFAEGNLADARSWYEKPLKQTAPLKVQIGALYNLILTDLAEAKFQEAQNRIQLLLEKANQPGAPTDITQVNDALEWMLRLNDPAKNETALGYFTQTLLHERQHEFRKAVDLLKQLVEQHPNDPIADDALLRQANFYQKLGEFANSIHSCQVLIQNYPRSFLCDQAKLKIGKIYETDLAQSETALREYEAFLVEYPRSVYLDEVRRRIRELQKNL